MDIWHFLAGSLPPPTWCIGRFCQRQICATCSLLDRHLLVKFWLSNIFLPIWIPSNSSSPSHTKIWSNAGLMSFLNSFKDRLPFPSWMMTMRNSCEVVAVWTTLRLYPQGIFTTLRAWYRNTTFTTPWQCGNRDVSHYRFCWDLQTKSRLKTFPQKINSPPPKKNTQKLII